MKRVLFLRLCCSPLVIVPAVLLLTAPLSRVTAQDEKKDTPTETAATDEAETPDPFAVPEGGADELEAFIQKMRRYRPTAKTREGQNKEMESMLTAVVAAAKQLRTSNPTEAQETFAIENQYAALSALISRTGAPAAELEALTTELKNDPRPHVARLGILFGLQSTVTAAARGTAEEREEAAASLVAFTGEHGADMTVVSLTTSLGRAMGYAGETDAAIKLYETVAASGKLSADAAVSARAEKLLGAARMLRLPGNFMEVSGTKADGTEFDWAAYRGKVVLVDFWASWCGPCIGELPNMKANLAKYGDKGFTIVGVNLDSTREAFDKCVSEKEITWENIMGTEGSQGWDNPLATYYGISAIPTAILVDKDGKVVSLRARGTELDNQLAALLGPVEEPAETKSETETDQ